ncbi:MAG TPA: CvpA family protein, partial [Candidatus Polarisedimenticolia bacterium]|nr:CvpA family protein [Candidatus Polarisedimenticolia bacterium]
MPGELVDIQTFLRSFNTFDLLIVLVLMGLFILGFIQGTVRRLLGIASIIFSFLVAAQLREPLG